MPSLQRMSDVEPTFRYDRGYKVTGGLPGMSEKEIEVAVTDDTLTLKGEKRQEKEQKEKNFYLSERSHGSEGAGTAIEIDL